MLKILQELIRIPSYSGQEQDIQRYIKQQLENTGIRPFFQGDNLIAHFKGKTPSRAFIFNSHVDVVDVGGESKWIHSPWSATIENGRIYGRGASDMKSGVFASMTTAITLAQNPELPCDVWFTYVVREETDGSGTKEFAEWFKREGYRDRYHEMAAVFTEPTSLTHAEYGHRGNFFIKASIDGESGHSSRPQQIKKHAILEMIKFFSDLQKKSAAWAKEFANGEFAPPTITPTAIEAISVSSNRVSPHCEAFLDLRTIPTFHQEAFDAIETLAKRQGISLSLRFPHAPSGYTDPNSRIVRELKKLVPDLKLVVSEGSADLGFLTPLGVEGVIFGPGEKKQGHTINESAPIDQILAAPLFYEKLYLAWAQAP